VIVGLLALALGVLTAYAQGWLPLETASLANSSGSWALVAFLLALLAPGAFSAAACGVVALAALLAGYVVGAGIRGYASGTGLIVFWGLAAVLVGPFLGLGARWVRSGRRTLAALGVGGMSGVLVGEGIYGLAYVADTTYPPYWWGEIAVGLALLCAIAALRLRRPRPIVLAAASSAAVAAAFIAVYGHGADLIAYFS
jgi:hypothetical protein